MISNLHYITQNSKLKTHPELCEEMCKAGAKWVQLRMKEVSDDEYLSEAVKCRNITQRFDAKLIINDNLDVALRCKADGVHLGKNDLNTKKARELAGEGFIIGGTANTFEQIKKHTENGADYVGVGPFRFTETKKNLSPVLGIEGYQFILEQMRTENIKIPLIAIGGIQISDIQRLKSVGVHGVAVSGMLTNSENKEQDIKHINKIFDYATA